MRNTGRCFIGLGLVAFLGQAAPLLAAAAVDATGSFSITAPTEVPGAVLKPGTYKIHVVDHLSDRAIVQLDGTSGSTHVTFLGVNAQGAGNDAPHPVKWAGKAKGRHALRGFIFQNGSRVEFVYPKADAVALANANSASVVAIDPASEGRPELSKLTNQDMQMVSLWMLTPVRVGPGKGQKGIEARHYEQIATASARPPAPPLPQGGAHSAGVTATAAQTPVTAPSPYGTATSEGRVVPPPIRQSRPQRMVARNDAPTQLPTTHRTASRVTQLPQTASNLPLMWIAGFLCLAGAGAMRLRAVQRG